MTHRHDPLNRRIELLEETLSVLRAERDKLPKNRAELQSIQSRNPQQILDWYADGRLAPLLAEWAKEDQEQRAAERERLLAEFNQTNPEGNN